MRKTALASLVVILAPMPLAGCGREPAPAPFTPTQAANLEQMKDAMSKNLKTKNYVDRATK